jgi:hypothetical protein
LAVKHDLKTRSEVLAAIKAGMTQTEADKMRAGSAAEKDALCRILFLNLRVNNEKVVDYLWKEPFDTLVKSSEIGFGGGTWT